LKSYYIINVFVEFGLISLAFPVDPGQHTCLVHLLDLLRCLIDATIP